MHSAYTVDRVIKLGAGELTTKPVRSHGVIGKAASEWWGGGGQFLLIEGALATNGSDSLAVQNLYKIVYFQIFHSLKSAAKLLDKSIQITTTIYFATTLSS